MREDKTYIKIPQVNINDTEVYLSQWKIEDGSYVEQGQELVEIETSKKIVTLKAEMSGYIYYKMGERECVVGETIAVITQQRSIEEETKIKNTDQVHEENVKITAKAKRLAQENNIDINL